LQNETLSEQLHNNTQKKQNSTQKGRNLLLHTVELSTALVKVDIKVCLFNSKSMFTMCYAALDACWDTTTAWRH